MAGVTLTVAVVAGLGAAAAFGTATAVQHSAAHAQTGGAGVDVAGLGRLAGDRRWLLGGLCDLAGLALQVVALANGPVSVVQPLQVLGLLVALPVGALLAGARLKRGTVWSSAVLVAALADFLLLVGDPGAGRVPGSDVCASITVAMLTGSGLLLVAVRRATPGTRAVVYGITSGALYALTAVLLRALLGRFSTYHLGLLAHPSGVAVTVELITVGMTGLGVAQAAFQVGPLTASLPAQTATDPLVAVILGAAVLSEHVAVTPARIIGYTTALTAVLVTARALARATPRAACSSN
jgi:hypothetical protein